MNFEGFSEYTYDYNPFPNNRKRLYNAIYANNLQKVKSILKKISPNTLVDYGQSALNMAIDYGNIDIIYEFLNAGADPNIIDCYGKTALMCAASSPRYQNIEIVKMLLNFGADPTIQWNNKYPYQIAIVSEIKKILKDEYNKKMQKK